MVVSRTEKTCGLIGVKWRHQIESVKHALVIKRLGNGDKPTARDRLVGQSALSTTPSRLSPVYPASRTPAGMISQRSGRAQCLLSIGKAHVLARGLAGACIVHAVLDNGYRESTQRSVLPRLNCCGSTSTGSRQRLAGLNLAEDPRRVGYSHECSVGLPVRGVASLRLQ